MSFVSGKGEIVHLMKSGWYLQLDLITFIWQIKCEQTSMARRVNKSAVVALLDADIIEKVKLTEGSHYYNYDFYVLKNPDGDYP